METMKQVYLLLFFQGFYLGYFCQRWTFPRTFTALMGSCVEIPCTYDPALSSTVWYIYNSRNYPEILNTKDSSSVLKEYRNRTSLVPGEKSCTLRIDPVRREDSDRYYPGITENKYINAYSRMLSLDVIEKTNVWISWNEPMTEGEATTLRCSAEHTCYSSPPFLQWNKPGEVKNMSVKISEGSWREESELTYIPSYLDDETSVRCTVTFPNGKRTRRSTELKIFYAATGVHITMKNGSKFTALICDFLSSRPDVTHYTWMKDGSILLSETGKTVTLYNNGENNGQYSCIAHNIAGNSSSEQVHVERDAVDLPLILGTVAGVFLILFSTLVVFLCTRQNKKSALPTSPIHGTVPARIPCDNPMAKDQHGNIGNNRHSEEPSMSSG
ncbi:B-cell receptor CD22-like [Dendropsophus ebraccatus]|uniref:B-cell receptor CD22-like n=1 Tax=Dendropsophus ebraccatus TaxID=150705 RepID=UPI0038322F93